MSGLRVVQDKRAHLPRLTTCRLSASPFTVTPPTATSSSAPASRRAGLAAGCNHTRVPRRPAAFTRSLFLAASWRSNTQPFSNTSSITDGLEVVIRDGQDVEATPVVVDLVSSLRSSVSSAVCNHLVAHLSSTKASASVAPAPGAAGDLSRRSRSSSNRSCSLYQ